MKNQTHYQKPVSVIRNPLKKGLEKKAQNQKSETPSERFLISHKVAFDKGLHEQASNNHQKPLPGDQKPRP